MSSEIKCRLCDSFIEDIYCSYCGFQNVEVVGSDAKQADEKVRCEIKNELLFNISEIGIIGYCYREVDEDDEVICNKEYFPLLSVPQQRNDTIDWTSRDISVFNGNELSLYMKYKQDKDEELFSEKINVPTNIKSFCVSANINNNLKLDMYYHTSENSDGIKFLENIKLGKTLITG